VTVRTIAAHCLRPVQVVASAWNTFWYSPGDPTVLGFMRLFVGGMLFYTHLVWGLNLQAFLGSSGWNSPDVLVVVQEGQMAPSFWWYVTDQWLLPVHCACLGILFLFWIGFATRVTSVLSMVITISYSYRAHMSNFGLDQINAILCLYLCIGPSGAVLSVDRWLAVWKARRRAARRKLSFVIPPVKPSITANLAIRLVQIHFCVIYTYAGLSKLQGGAWWSGEAVWLAFANLEYQSLNMTWIAWYPWISDLMTHSTIMWEISFAALVWVRPVRPIVLAIGFGLHAGIGGMMGLWTFGLIMIFGHLSFWPAETVYWLVGRIPVLRSLLGNGPVATTALLSTSARLVTNGAVIAMDSTSKNELFATRELPALLWVDREVRRSLKSLQYFWERGFRCRVSSNMQEANTDREVTHPAAIVLIGTELPDDDVAVFHDDHYSRPDAQPLFMVLTEAQSQRLNGRIHTPGSHVLTGKVSLGRLRRKIEDKLFETEAPDNRLAREHEQLPASNSNVGVN